MRVESVVIGTAGGEVSFQTGTRLHRVGERGRFELHSTLTLSDPPVPTNYVERDCYRRHPAPVRGRTGCAGCTGGGGPGLFMVAAVIALRRRRA